ncbi:MAG: hypothetical protein JKY27_00345 [Magnetovibrio sp.]|nr:hypothetical protein [Magnetovibrio sp.]
MIANTVDIKVVTDYTAFTNTVRFQVAVPVSNDDATAIYKDLSAGDWSKSESAIKAAVQKSAPTQIVALVETLLNAYSGTDSSNGTAAVKKDPDPAPTPADPAQKDPD